MKSFLAANKNSPERLLRSSPYCPQNGDCQSLRLAGKCVFTGNSNRCFFLSKIRLFSGLHFWPKKTHNDNTQTKAIYKITAVAVEQNLPNNTMVRNTERQHNNGHKTRNLWWEHRIFDMEEFSSKINLHTHTKITIVRTKGSLRQDCRLVVDPCKDLLATIPSSLSASSRGVEGDEVKL